MFVLEDETERGLDYNKGNPTEYASYNELLQDEMQLLQSDTFNCAIITG